MNNQLPNEAAMKKQIMKWVGLLALVIGQGSVPVWAKDAAIYTAVFSKTAVSGYDTVAYFTEGKPVKGDPAITANYQGAEWRFANTANRDKFSAQPDKYAPQYGGYCAWAVSQGNTASADPQRWTIVKDKLYLNYDEAVQKKWEVNIPDFIQQADKNWPKVLE
ncbi:YHS domain-containing (seleno)protein [Jezberella montanilacus]|nr:YHS domain-containing (seleno)protein [Jezberella montanilacus]